MHTTGLLYQIKVDTFLQEAYFLVQALDLLKGSTSVEVFPSQKVWFPFADMIPDFAEKWAENSNYSQNTFHAVQQNVANQNKDGLGVRFVTCSDSCELEWMISKKVACPPDDR